MTDRLHTSGPWVHSGNAICTENPPAIVALVQRLWANHEEITGANARLIAASPDLLEALDEILHMGHDCPATFAGSEIDWERHRAKLMQAIASAAIAKATVGDA